MPVEKKSFLGYSLLMERSVAEFFLEKHRALPGVLRRLRFGFVEGIPAAGMAEPWKDFLPRTLAALHEQGVGAILTLTEDDPFGADYRAAGFTARHLPMDDGDPASGGQLAEAMAFLDDCAGKGFVTCVHCLEGRGRTGMVLWAFLARYKGMAPLDALALLRKLRPWTALAHGQKECVIEFLEK